MSLRSRPWWLPALFVALVLGFLSGATPFSWYSSTFEHAPRSEPPAGVDVERRPIVTTIWSSGPLAPALDALDLDPDLYVHFRRLDWSGSWWTPLWKSGKVEYAVEAQVFGGAAQGGCELVFEGELHATFRGLCSPERARDDLTEELRRHVQAEVRERVGS